MTRPRGHRPAHCDHCHCHQVFNTAQIEALKEELFEPKENTGRLFNVIQDFSKNMRAIENSFDEF
jgi:hypothetical protein